jgi:hypothetical protein
LVAAIVAPLMTLIALPVRSSGLGPRSALITISGNVSPLDCASVGPAMPAEHARHNATRTTDETGCDG